MKFFNCEMVVAGRELTQDEHMQLRSLDCRMFKYKTVQNAVRHLTTQAYGLVITPGWENDDDAVLLVQVAKAFQVPVKTHLGWLQTLPSPPDPNEPDELGTDGLGNPAGSPADHTTYIDDAEGSAAPWEYLDDAIDLHSGETIFAHTDTVAAGYPEFVEIVNLEADAEGQELVQRILDRKAGKPDTSIRCTARGPLGTHRWVITEEGAYGCEDCGAAA